MRHWDGLWKTVLFVQARVGKGALHMRGLLVRRSLSDKEEVPSAIDCFITCSRVFCGHGVRQLVLVVADVRMQPAGRCSRACWMGLTIGPLR